MEIRRCAAGTRIKDRHLSINKSSHNFHSQNTRQHCRTEQCFSGSAKKNLVGSATVLLDLLEVAAAETRARDRLRRRGRKRHIEEDDSSSGTTSEDRKISPREKSRTGEREEKDTEEWDAHSSSGKESGTEMTAKKRHLPNAGVMSEVEYNFGPRNVERTIGEPRGTDRRDQMSSMRRGDNTDLNRQPKEDQDVGRKAGLRSVSVCRRCGENRKSGKKWGHVQSSSVEMNLEAASEARYCRTLGRTRKHRKAFWKRQGWGDPQKGECSQSPALNKQDPANTADRTTRESDEKETSLVSRRRRNMAGIPTFLKEERGLLVGPSLVEWPAVRRSHAGRRGTRERKLTIVRLTREMTLTETVSQSSSTSSGSPSCAFTHSSKPLVLRHPDSPLNSRSSPCLAALSPSLSASPGSRVTLYTGDHDESVVQGSEESGDSRQLTLSRTAPCVRTHPASLLFRLDSCDNWTRGSLSSMSSVSYSRSSADTSETGRNAEEEDVSSHDEEQAAEKTIRVPSGHSKERDEGQGHIPVSREKRSSEGKNQEKAQLLYTAVEEGLAGIANQTRCPYLASVLLGAMHFLFFPPSGPRFSQSPECLQGYSVRVNAPLLHSRYRSRLPNSAVPGAISFPVPSACFSAVSPDSCSFASSPLSEVLRYGDELGGTPRGCLLPAFQRLKRCLMKALAFWTPTGTDADNLRSLMDVEPFVCSSPRGPYVRFMSTSSISMLPPGDGNGMTILRQEGREGKGKKTSTEETNHGDRFSELSGLVLAYGICPNLYELMRLIPLDILLELHRDALLLTALEILFVFSNLADSKRRIVWICGSSSGSDSRAAGNQGCVDGLFQASRFALGGAFEGPLRGRPRGRRRREPGSG
ncbi:hypothetical protein CSUI_001759, partial [Cystoisospora suis]